MRVRHRKSAISDVILVGGEHQDVSIKLLSRTLADSRCQRGLVVFGANAAAQEAQLQEVVVTAERRSENIQNVPIAVTAFTAETLASRNLTDVHSLGNLTPGVNLDAGAPFSADRSVLSASIRGIGQDDFAFNLNPGVGVYLDGVFLARTIGANQNLLDVDRIEILKGPQGTLFGANTIGGAISIVTHTPGNETPVHRPGDGRQLQPARCVIHGGPADHQGRAAVQHQRVLAEPDGLGESHSLSDQLPHSVRRPSSLIRRTCIPSRATRHRTTTAAPA